MAFDGSVVYANASEARDIYRELTEAYVPPGEENVELKVLQQEDVDVLKAIAATLIPGNAHWPSAADVNVIGYVDRTLELAPSLEAPVSALISAFRSATDESGLGENLESMPLSYRSEILHATELQFPLGLRLFKELTYECYYRHQSVTQAIRDRTGFHTQLPSDGVGLAESDDIFTMLPERDGSVQVRGIDL